MVLAAEVQELFGRLRKQHPARGGGGVLLRTMSSLWSAAELGVCSAAGVTALSEAERVRTGGANQAVRKWQRCLTSSVSLISTRLLHVLVNRLGGFRGAIKIFSEIWPFALARVAEGATFTQP